MAFNDWGVRTRRVLAFVVLALVATAARAQVAFVATIGGQAGYKAPYVEGSVEAKHHFEKLLVFGEARAASGRKSDTGDGLHFGTRAVAAYRMSDDYPIDVGGGVAYSKQWTSAYEKSAVRPVVYVGWKQLDAFYLFRGNDRRNGQQGVEIRWTEMLSQRWGMRFSFVLLRGYQTDRPLEPLTIGGAGVGAVYVAR